MSVLALALAALALATPGPPAAGAAPRADAALVLSGDVDYLRLQRAIALYKAGAVPRLVLTGRGKGGDSALEMRRVALATGVPGEAILVETRSTSTRENLLFAAPLLHAQTLGRVLLVTSESHMERALGAARRAVPDVDWIPERVPDAGDAERIRRMREEERLKLLYYALMGWL